MDWHITPFMHKRRNNAFPKGVITLFQRSASSFASYVRIPASTGRSRKNRKWQLHCQALGNIGPYKTDAPCHIRCDMLKIPHWSYRLKFAALHRWWGRLHSYVLRETLGEKKKTKQNIYIFSRNYDILYNVLFQISNLIFQIWYFIK